MVLGAEITETKETQVTPIDSPRAGGRGGEGDRAAIQSKGDSLIHLFAQEIFSK